MVTRVSSVEETRMTDKHLSWHLNITHPLTLGSCGAPSWGLEIGVGPNNWNKVDLADFHVLVHWLHHLSPAHQHRHIILKRYVTWAASQTVYIVFSGQRIRSSKREESWWKQNFGMMHQSFALARTSLILLTIGGLLVHAANSFAGSNLYYAAGLSPTDANTLLS